METKICTKCGEEKPLTEFNFKDRKRNKLQARCKKCQRERERELYNTLYKYKNRELYSLNRKIYRDKMREIIAEAKSEGCVLCGEKELCCLDFHHLYDKEFVIAKGYDASLERLNNELQKCVVLCANCHRKLHAGKIKLSDTYYKNIKQMTINFKKLSDKAVQPVRTTTSGAGYNLTVAAITTEINERGQLVIVYHTNLAVEVPEGYEGVIRPLPSIAAKTLRMCDAPSVITGGIDDEIVAKFVSTTDVIPAVYKEGEQFAQLVFNKIEDVEFIEIVEPVDEDSAATEPQSPSESEDMSINSDPAPEPAAGENAPEQA